MWLITLIYSIISKSYITKFKDFDGGVLVFIIFIMLTIAPIIESIIYKDSKIVIFDVINSIFNEYKLIVERETLDAALIILDREASDKALNNSINQKDNKNTNTNTIEIEILNKDNEELKIKAQNQ